MWVLKLHRRCKLERGSIKIYAEVAGFARGVFKIYPEISTAMHIAMHAAACRFFVGWV